MNFSTKLAYRYATPETFQAMLDSEELWFSDLRYMNDWDEYAAGFRIAEEVVKTEFPQNVSILNEIAPDKMNTNFMILICSFSKAADSLSMWSQYADDGRGAAIGYDTDLIWLKSVGDRFLQKKEPVIGRPLFFSVIYQEDIFKAELRKYLLQAQLPERLPPEEIINVFRIKNGMLKTALLRLCSLYKDHFFQDEREIRGLIEIDNCVDPYVINLHEGSFGEAHQHRLNTNFFTDPSIREIVLGPLNTLNEDQLKKDLALKGMGHVTVSRSRGTYR